MNKTSALLAALLLAAGNPSLAHEGRHPSVHDTVAEIALRLRQKLPEAELRALSQGGVEGFLSPGEREILGSQHLRFRVSVPVVVTVFHDVALGTDPFWLRERGFRGPGESFGTTNNLFAPWQRDFPAGEIGLGINSLRGGGNHYFVAVRPQKPGETLVVDELYPGQLRLGTLAAGVQPYTDRDEVLPIVPPRYTGQILVRTQRAWRDVAKLIRAFRWTDHPAGPRPDHVVLTWSDDPRTTQTIQWRTSTQVKRGAVSFIRKADLLRPNPHRPRKRSRLKPVPLEDRFLANDPVVHRFTARLTGLEPGTTYLYSVGDGSAGGWTEFAEFTTAPARVVPFSFVYMGDAQNGLDRWGTLLRNAQRARPDAAFHLMAGDLVNRGAERDDWDSFFQNAAGVFDRRQLVPVIGNHECQGGHPTFYLRQFALMTNGPAGVEHGRAYAFEYSNALFVVLDSNLPPESQTAWLEQRLAASRATWKFVSYHHPAYSSAPKRDNLKLRDAWVPIFDRHHVDLAMQGHDHAYLRTFPMKGHQRAESPGKGTIYVVSVSGTKMYEQDPRDYTQVGFTKIALYQVLDVQLSGNRLIYRAYDTEGTLRDHFEIEK